MERSIDDYANEFQANWRKVDERRMISAESVLADFMLGLDPNISIMLYGLASESLDKAIKKAKMIKID